MKRLLNNRWAILALRVIIGGVFLYAGAAKMRTPQAFSDSIATFQLLPEAWINLLALGLPPFEILVGGLLVLGWRKRVASLGVLLLIAFFGLALGSALARGLAVDCGCFGSGMSSPWDPWLALGRDGFLAVGGMILYWKTWNSDAAKVFPAEKR